MDFELTKNLLTQDGLMYLSAFPNHVNKTMLDIAAKSQTYELIEPHFDSVAGHRNLFTPFLI